MLTFRKSQVEKETIRQALTEALNHLNDTE
jgi:hypothetical protein